MLPQGCRARLALASDPTLPEALVPSRPKVHTRCRRRKPMSSFKCSDTGMECSFEVHGASSRDEVMQIASVHAKAAHGLASIPPEMVGKVSAAIRD